MLRIFFRVLFVVKINCWFIKSIKKNRKIQLGFYNFEGNSNPFSFDNKLYCIPSSRRAGCVTPGAD